MIVEELIEQLRTFPLDTLVVRGDNSGGYEKVYQVKEEKVYDNHNSCVSTVVLD